VGDPSTLPDARATVARYHLDLPESVRRALADSANETPKPGDAVFAGARFALAARPAEAFRVAEAAVRAAGLDCILLGTDIEGEARAVAAQHAALARKLRQDGRRAVILSGGELTVTLRPKGPGEGRGRGGPNQEYVLALVEGLAGMPGLAALAGDTDGTDGGSGSADDPAGAFADSGSLDRARALGVDPAAYLHDNNSTEFFMKLGDLLSSGPTYTNINDFRAILVDSR
jgi:hydroxypyruvate reductase